MLPRYTSPTSGCRFGSSRSHRFAATRRTAIVGLVAIAAAAAGGGTAPAAGTAACPTARELVRLPHQRPLAGDVDGDGRPDRSFLVVDRRAPERCRFFLVALTETGPHATALHSRFLPRTAAALSVPGAPPSLDLLADIDRAPGAEAVVRLTQGASVSGAAVYTFRAGAFRPLPIVGSPAGLFQYNGGATILSGVDCLDGRRSGAVVQILGGELGSSGTRWRVERDVFVTRSGRFVRTTRTVRSFRGSFEQLVRAVPAASGAPFRSCHVAG